MLTYEIEFVKDLRLIGRAEWRNMLKGDQIRDDSFFTLSLHKDF